MSMTSIVALDSKTPKLELSCNVSHGTRRNITLDKPSGLLIILKLPNLSSVRLGFEAEQCVDRRFKMRNFLAGQR